MICGGTIERSAQDMCFTFKRNGKWSNQINLTQKLSYTNAIESPDRDFELFTAAGFDGGAAISFSQVYRDSKWMLADADLPVSVWLHCTIKLDETTVMVTGGAQGPIAFSNQTFMLNASMKSGWAKGKIASSYFE